jgi:AcrR family transcriptional regulator
MYVKSQRMTRAESQAATRAALLDAGASVFIERGFAGASVERIAEAAGYTRGAFYSNFGSKEELFAELLQQRVYARYAEMAERQVPTTLRAAGEQLAEIQADREGRWLFRLWLELLAHSGRDGEFRKIAAGFWKGNRSRTADLLRRQYEAAGEAPPAPPEHLATAMIAVDIGLALQHFVDEREVPLDLYPDLYELLFEPLAPGRG